MLKTTASKSFEGVTSLFFVYHSELDHHEVTQLLLNCKSLSKQPVSRVQGRGLRSVLFLFSVLLTPFLAVVSDEPRITPLASGTLNAKLCLVNKAVCLDSFSDWSH